MHPPRQTSSNRRCLSSLLSLLSLTSCTFPVSSPPMNTPHTRSIETTTGQRIPLTHRITVEEKTFDVALATTDAERSQGLMHVPTLPEDTGMLFVFAEPDIYGFWMKNTLVPLTGVWIDHEYAVVDVLDMQPCTADPCPSYAPALPATLVLELPLGAITRAAIGQKITLSALAPLLE
ncbi:DUF192 domain-containing protein [Candidatus Peribacteria bacterium]|nr:DUF192 domain-containing protein [Candidatus Peribacteria bacterium]